MTAKSTILEHVTTNGIKLRWCVRCGLHVDEQNQIDQDFYTARQYFKFQAVPLELRCKHERVEPTPGAYQRGSVSPAPPGYNGHIYYNFPAVADWIRFLANRITALEVTTDVQNPRSPET